MELGGELEELIDKCDTVRFSQVRVVRSPQETSGSDSSYIRRFYYDQVTEGCEYLNLHNGLSEV